MILLGMMRFVKDQDVDSFNIDKPQSQAVSEDLCSANNHVALAVVIFPCLFVP